MKKILAVILALMLCCSFALFAACDDQPAVGPGGNGGGNEATGEIEGNYEETTSEDLATTLSSIDSRSFWAIWRAKTGASALPLPGKSA